MLERLPEPDKLWAWLGDQTDEKVLEFLACCVAVTVNAVRRKGDGHQQARSDHADMLAEAVGLDMADWWEPSGDRYLNRVPKAQIVTAISEAVSPEAAETLRPMKKDAMALKAGEFLAVRRWLPEALRPVDASLVETA
jgi:ParB family chromosome partitioning protein